MENIIPVNGRIAIVDDNINQALPLLREFSKHNIPYTYYKGDDYEYLPEQPENDIRILFLDLNLLSSRTQQTKEVKGALLPVLKRIVSPQNYPYILIVWSVQEEEYLPSLMELFENELKKCAPIAIKKWIKSDYFTYDGEAIQNADFAKIITSLKAILKDLHAYSYLLQWENCVHDSADATVQSIFHESQINQDWAGEANCIFDLFAHSYLEKGFSPADDVLKTKSSLLFFNDIFNDTLEQCIWNQDIENACQLKYDNITEEKKHDIKAKVNTHLLLSSQYTSPKHPGCVLGFDSEVDFNLSKELLNDSTSMASFRPDEKDTKELKQEMHNWRTTVYEMMKPCAIVVTPACDHAQNKAKNIRLVRGIIVKDCHREHFDRQSEAIYISPSFNYENNNCILVLNFRYFFTCQNKVIKDDTVIFRLRSTVLSEIQSKLARHISRQGIMNL